MALSKNVGHLGYVPTEARQLYPDTDGQPMAVSDDHRRVLIRVLRVLETFFTQNPDVYVSGDILMYYVQGDPRKVVAPDVLVTFGIGQKARRTYQVWVEGKPPDFVMELSSKTTYQRDLGEKMEIYAALGITDYFLCDIEGLYLPESLMGFTLVNGSYHRVSSASDGGIASSVLGLEFHLFPEDLQIYDPSTRAWLLTPEEAAEAQAEQETRARQQAEDRAEQAEDRAEQAEDRAEQAEDRAATAEAEAEDLRAELARLRSNHAR